MFNTTRPLVESWTSGRWIPGMTNVGPSASFASARRRIARASKTLKARKASLPSFPWRKMKRNATVKRHFWDMFRGKKNTFSGNPKFWMRFILSFGTTTKWLLPLKAHRLPEEICVEHHQVPAEPSHLEPLIWILLPNAWHRFQVDELEPYFHEEMRLRSSVKCAATPGDLGAGKQPWHGMCQDWPGFSFDFCSLLFIQFPQWQSMGVSGIIQTCQTLSNNKWALGLVWKLDTRYENSLVSDPLPPKMDILRGQDQDPLAISQFAK